jgi:hypothetical protein
MSLPTGGTDSIASRRQLVTVGNLGTAAQVFEVPPGQVRRGRPSVDDFVAVGAPRINRNSFNAKHLRPTEFNRVQQLLESGSGPGGRRFKSSHPDQSFQALKLQFWFSVYIDGVDFVDGTCFADSPEDFQ